MAFRADLAAGETGRIVSQRGVLQAPGDGVGREPRNDPACPGRRYGAYFATEKGIVPSETS